MQRFPPFDPPEYVSWKPDPALVRAYRATIEADPERAAVVSGLSADGQLALYAGLLRARLHDIQLQRWVRTGVISKAWLGTGEEATTVGPVHALERGKDIVAPMIRNAAACCELGMPLADTLRAYLGSGDSPSRGRDLHVGSFSRGVLQPISHVGDMVPVICGIALTFKMKGERRVALTWVGDGATKTAAAHEGTNFAAVQQVPAIFVIQNNQVALGTRLDQHHLARDFKDWPASYGIWSAEFDGNNVLDAWAATRLAAERCRDRKSTRLNSSHRTISYAVFCLKKKNTRIPRRRISITRRCKKSCRASANIKAASPSDDSTTASTISHYQSAATSRQTTSTRRSK